MKKCLKCGKENTDETMFCVFCGTKFQEESVSYCANCGTKMEAGSLFCPKCGQKKIQPLNQVQPEQNVPEQSRSEVSAQGSQQPVQEVLQQESQQPRQEIPQQGTQQPVQQMQAMQQMNPGAQAEVEQTGKTGSKKLNKPVVVTLAIVAALVIVVAVTGIVRICGFKNYVSSFQEECQAFPSMGKYEEDYGRQMDEADRILSGFQFWKTGKQKNQMQELNKIIAEMNQKVAKYQQAYQDGVAKIEDSGNYFTGDYEKEYKDSKEACEKALKDFDEEDCKEETEAFTKLVDDIISYNENEGTAMVSYVKTTGDNLYSCENYLLSQRAGNVKKAYKEKQYKQEKEHYDAYQNWKQKFSTQGTIGDYDQVDVSENKKINLYVSGNNKDEAWSKDSFLIYEKKSRSEEWTPCTVEEIKQIKGNMSIDLVADISTSMEYQFDDMKNCLSQFADETEADTSLGLSTISSIYERKLTFTKDKNSVETAIDNLECQGSTCLYQSLYSSVLYTASATGSRCVVAFTDGKNEPYESGYDYYEDDVINIATTYQIPIYIIGIGDGIEANTLQHIAEATGGFYRNIAYVSALYDVYNDIYEKQKSTYQIKYSSSLKSRENREVYVYGESNDGMDVIRFQSGIDAEVLADAYASSDDIDASNLASYYTKKKYISQYDLENITDVNEIQTIINIYYAKNGYKFTNGDVLETMKKLGVMSGNGTKSMDAAVKSIKKNPKLFKNLMALYNYRYELFYNLGIDVYYGEGYTEYSDFEEEMNYQLGESTSSSRYKDLIKKIYKKMEE